MGYVVIKRIDDRIELVSLHEFTSREEALIDLSETLVDPDVWAEGGSYVVVDLDSSCPVLVLPITPRLDAPDEEAPEDDARLAPPATADFDFEDSEGGGASDIEATTSETPLDEALSGYPEDVSDFEEQMADLAIAEVVLAEASGDVASVTEFWVVESTDDVTPVHEEHLVETADGPEAGEMAAEDQLTQAEETPDTEREPEEEAEPPMPGYEAGESDIDSLSCDECVFAGTCPNKEERTPSACGSFQWVTP